MSMSTYLLGIKPPDSEFQRMYDAYKACEAAGVEVPKKVAAFFNDEEPDPAGVVVHLGSRDTKNGVKEWGDDGRAGIEVDLAKLSKDIKILRFVNSW